MIKYANHIDSLILSSGKSRIFSSERYNKKANSLSKLVEKISRCRKYKKEKDKIIDVAISIECPSYKNNFVLLGDVMPETCTLVEYKKMISAIADIRMLYLSPNMDEIYSEWIDAIDNKHAPVAIFDYGLMYSKYKKYKNGDLVKVPNWSHCDYYTNVLKIKEPRFMKDSIVKYDDNHSTIGCMYTGIFLRENGDPEDSIWDTDVPIPVSLFKPLNEEGQYNGKEK